MQQTGVWTDLGFVRMVDTRFDDVKTHHRVNIHPHDSQTFFVEPFAASLRILENFENLRVRGYNDCTDRGNVMGLY